MNENVFQSWLIKELKKRFTGCIVMKTDPTYIQGMPDILILFRNCWASLEVKKNSKARHQPNQDFWVKKMNAMSFSRFISPDNCDKVLGDLAEFFRSKTPISELVS